MAAWLVKGMTKVMSPQQMREIAGILNTAASRLEAVEKAKFDAQIAIGAAIRGIHSAAAKIPSTNR